MSSRAVLIFSLGLNAVLGTTAVYLVTRPAPTAPAPVEAAPVKVVKQKVEVTTVETNTVVKQINWEVVESADYKKYIANLRSIGCPEETIQDIIKADVDKLFAARRKEITKPTSEFKFWETGMQAFMGNAADPETLAKLQALTQEKKALLKDLLGIDVEDKPDLMAAFNPFERLLSFLPAEKQTKVMEMMQQMQAKMMKTMGSGTPDEQDRKNMAQMQKDFDKSLAGMLDPQEYEQYQLRLSQTSMMMRMELDGFGPTEQEFRDLFKARKAFDDEFGGMFGQLDQSKEGREKYQAAQKELNDQIKKTLGEARYADYEREKDWQYKNVSKFVQRQNLPKEAAIKVWDTKKVAEAEAAKVRNDSNLSQEQKNTALQGIHQATQQNLQQTLGADAYQKYSDGDNARWLKSIAPPQSKPAGQ